VTPHSAVTPICPSPIVFQPLDGGAYFFQPSEFIFHTSSFSLYGLAQSSVFCHRASLVPHSARRPNPLHCTRTPKPPWKGGCNRAKGIVQTACQRNHGRGFKIFFTYRSSFSTLVFTNPFLARVVFDPPSPPKGGCRETPLNHPPPTVAAPACRWLLATLRIHRQPYAPTAAWSGSGLSTSGVRYSPNIMGHEYKSHHVAGRSPSGCPLEADYPPGGGRFLH